jgi:Galactose oxidase, central domain
MKQLTLALLAQLMLAGAASVAWGNEWENRGGRLNPAGGWFQWVQNTFDGRYCALGYHGDLQCYDPSTNVLETVYVNGSQTPDPQNGDLQIFGWDHVNMEYLAMDGGRTIGPYPMAFSMVTRTWRILTNADFDGIESRTKTSAAGSATSPDHDVFVVFGSFSGYTGRKTLIYDLRNRTYRELAGPASMPSRNHTQGQFLYIPSLRRFLLFGGDSYNSGPLNDLWLLDPVTWVWTSVTAQNPPSGRSFSQMAYDPLNDVVYLYGGNSAPDAGVWVLHLNTWAWEYIPEPAGIVLVDYPGIRRVGAGIFDSGAGFCSGAGILPGTNWIGSAEIWCWTHSFNGPPPPPPPVPGWVRTTDTPDQVRFEYRSTPPSGVDLYDCIVDATLINCQRR